MKTRGMLHSPWVVVGGCFVNLALAYTVWYSFSVFFVALLKDFGWSRASLSSVLSVFIIVHGSSGPLIGRVVDRFSPRVVFAAGSVCLAVGLFLSSLIFRPLEYYIFFGVLAALGVASVGWIPNTTIVQRYFTEKRGLAIGIISSGIGIGVLICVPSIQYLINEIGWRAAYRTLAIVIPLTIFSASIIATKKSAEAVFSSHENGDSTAINKDAVAIDGDWSSRIWTVREAMQTKEFWLSGFSFFLSSLTMQATLAHTVAFFVDEGLRPLLASYVIGVVGMVSVAGKILWGTLSDRLGREVIYTIGVLCSICGIMFLIIFTIFQAAYVPYCYAVLFGMGYAVTASLPPLIVADFFAGKAYGSIFGTLWIYSGTGAACGAWLAGLLYDSTGSYVPVFIILIFSSLMASVCLWKAAPRKARQLLKGDVLGRKCA